MSTTDSVLLQVIEVMVLPFQRVYTLLMSISVGGVSLGSLIIIGVLVSIVIGVITHYNGNIGFISRIFKKGGKNG